MDKELLEDIKNLLKIFDGFINYNFELILDEDRNIYTDLKLLENKKDLLKNIFEWKSRECSKFNDKETEEFRNNINKFLNKSIGRTFTKDEFEIIYINIGNGVNKKLTKKFIDSNFDLELLKERRVWMI